MPSKDVAELATSQLPELIQTPALDLKPEDVALSRIRMGQFSSKAVQNKKIEAGALYYSTGQDDPEPVVLDDEVVFHVLSLKKAKSYAPKGGQLERYDYGDPDAPDEAWVTYDYLVAVPSVDDAMPFKLMLTKSSLPAARQLNATIAKATVPHYSLAFALWTAERTSPDGKYWIAQVRQVEADPEHVRIAMDLAVAMSSSAVEAGAGRTDAQPDI